MADLNALIAQGAQFQAPTDPFAQYAKFQQLQQGQQANQLNLMKMQEYQRGLEEQNALRTRVSQPGFDIMNPEHQSQLMGAAPSLAPKYIDTALTGRKTIGEIKKSDFDLQKSKYEHGIKTLASADTPDKAIAAVDDAVAKGYFDKAAGDAEKAKIATAASAGQYEQYRTGMLSGLMDAKDQLEFRKPKPEKFDLNNKVVTIDMNPNSPTYKQQVAELKKGMSEYESQKLTLDRNAPQYMATDAGIVALPKVPGKGPITASIVTGPSGEALQRPLANIPVAANKAIITNEQNLTKAKDALNLIQGKSVGKMTGDQNATGWKGYLPDSWLQRMDPEGVDARATIADLGSMVLHDRSGAAVTAAEFPRLRPFIPLITDDTETVKKKLKKFVDVYEQEQNMLTQAYSKEQGYKTPSKKDTSAGKEDPLGIR